MRAGGRWATRLARTGGLALAVACAKPAPPQAAAPPAPEPAPERPCEENDFLAAGTDPLGYLVSAALGNADYEATGCSAEELGLDMSLGFAPPPEAELDVRLWSSIDSGVFTARLTRLPEDFDAETAMQAFLVKSLPGEHVATARSERLDIPVSWPVHPDSPSRDRAQLVAWWTPEPGAKGTSLRRQSPVPFAPCGGRANGALAHFDGEVLVLHAFSAQHFFPEGGCGG